MAPPFFWFFSVLLLGFTKGGLNFDAKLRRESFEPSDLFHAHIGGMDSFARGLKIASAIRSDGRLGEFVQDRYRSWDVGVGAEIDRGEHTFESLETYILAKGEADQNRSWRQEYLENLINDFI
jgi:xylose isomerase